MIYIFFVREKGGKCNFNMNLPFNLYRKVKFVNIGNKETIHPTEKTVNIIKDLIKVSSKENDIILDPYIGSGTTAVACKQLNRNFIGFEISQEYYDIANKRLSQTNIKDWFK
jgi:DNA modification methylase